MSSADSTGRWIRWLILFLLLGIALVFYLFDPGKLVLFPKCPFFLISGYYCPGCGSQRAIHSFLHLRFGDGFHNNFLIFPATLVILYHIARPFINKKFDASLPDILYHRRTPWIILFIVFIFWVMRNIPVEPFSWLAPV